VPRCTKRVPTKHPTLKLCIALRHRHHHTSDVSRHRRTSSSRAPYSSGAIPRQASQTTLERSRVPQTLSVNTVRCARHTTTHDHQPSAECIRVHGTAVTIARDTRRLSWLPGVVGGKSVSTNGSAQRNDECCNVRAENSSHNEEDHFLLAPLMPPHLPLHFIVSPVNHTK